MSFDIQSLREKQLNIATEARSKFEEIKDDTPEAEAREIESVFDKMMAEHDKIGDKIERLRKLEAAEAAVNESEPMARMADAMANGVAVSEAPTYADAFVSYLRSKTDGGRALTAEERSVLQTGYRAKSPEERAQTAGTDAAGGFTVPQEMASFITKSLAAWGPMADENVVTMLRTSSGEQITMPTVDDTATATVATAEGVTLTDDGGSDVTFGEATLDAYARDTEWLRVSLPLLQDSAFGINQFIGELLGERLARRVNTDLTTGTGSSQPHGVATAAAAGVTAAGVAAITGDELIDLMHSVDPAYRMSPKVRWMFNDSTLSEIRKLKDGQGNYLWQMGDVRAGEPATLLGKPFSVNQAMASLATGNRTVLFGDFGKYYTRMVGDVLIGAISDKDFWPGIGIAGYVRIDGELPDTAAIKRITQA